MKTLRDILLSNIVIKIVSLILAVLTWMYIAGHLYKEETEKEKEAPSIIEVSGEKLIVKRVPIYVNIEGSPAKGYEVTFDRITIKPSYSVVAGPMEVIKDLSYVVTEPININGASSNIRRNVRLMPVAKCRIEHKGLLSVIIPVAKERHKG